MNTTPMNEVAMKVNQANLVNSLRFSFTNKTNVFSELMQNSRRAQATQVNFNFCSETKTLQVVDDGCGIDSIETLLTVAESGWDAELIAIEHAYGMGFLSALFACRHISIISKSGSIAVDTDAVLDFKPVTITPVNDWNGVTTITLHDVDLAADQIVGVLRRCARGFPIPVLFNGEHLERPAAMDSGLDFVTTDIGAVYLHGLQEPIGAQYEFDLYLQGLPIYSSDRYYSSRRHIIHLDSARFHARLPDRDKLIDEAEVIKQVHVMLAVAIEKRLLLLKAEKTPEEFVRFYDMMRHWNLLKLLNDVPVVPVEALSEISCYPVCDTELFDEFELRVDKALTRAEIAARGVVSIDDDISLDGSARYLFAREKDYLIYDGKLDSGHWLQPLVRDLNAEELTIECVNSTHAAQFQGSWRWISVRFCDAYRIKLGEEVVEITEDAIYLGHGHGEEAIVPKGDGSAQVLTQVSNYRNEWDEHQQTIYEADCDAFIAFVVANTTTDPAEAMQRLLPGFSGCPALYGKSFVLTLNASGHVASVSAA